MAAKGITLPIIYKSDDSGLKNASKQLDGFSKTVGKIGGLIAGAFAIGKIASFAKESVLAAEAVATANARIEQIAKSTQVFGAETEQVTSRLIALAEANEIRLATDAEVIKGVQGQLLSFKQLSSSADEAGGAFDRATMAAFDMAAAGFGSAESNATALGKALEDPIKGISALARTGTVFTDEQKEQIRVLQESGNLIGAQELILNELESQYGGVAAATADASDQLALAADNIKESFGAQLLPVFAELAEGLIPVFDEISTVAGETMAELAPILMDIVEAIPSLVSSLVPLIPIIGEVAGIFFELVEMILPYVVQFLEMLLPVIADLMPVIGDLMSTALVPIMEIFFLLIEALMPIVEALLPVLADMIVLLAPIVVTLVEALMPLVMELLPLFIGAIEFLTPILEVIAEIIGVLLVTAIGWFVEAIAGVTETIGIFSTFFEDTFGGVKEFFYGIINSMIAAFESFVNGAIRGVNSIIGAINSLSWEIPDWVPDFGGKRFGFNIPKLGEITLPRIALADGGIVTGPINALIGEAGPEAVIPLDRMGKISPTYNITVNAGVGDPVRIGEEVVSAIKRYERVSGPVFASA